MRPPPPTPPDIRVRIRRFGGLSEHLFPREGWSPGFENARRRGCFGPCTAAPSGFTFQRLAYRTDGTAFLPHGTFEMPVSTSRFQPFRPSVELLRLLCRLLTSPPRSRALRPAQSGHPDTSEISRSCASLILRHHQAGWRTFTSKLSIMLGTPKRPRTRRGQVVWLGQREERVPTHMLSRASRLIYGWSSCPDDVPLRFFQMYQNQLAHAVRIAFSGRGDFDDRVDHYISNAILSTAL